MRRLAINQLNQWLESKTRKPLVVRGMRQVGKTWLARHLAQTNDKLLIELNFEKNPEYRSLFSDNEPKQILINIEAALNLSIDPKQSLLFLDEIQAAPELLAKLRWFAEDLPQLAVITAGSLLEFVLSDHQFNMPVGRISYFHLEPLSFEEFLLAKSKDKLFDYIQNHQIDKPIAKSIHQQLISLFKEYIIIGGLPAAVASWVDQYSLTEISRVHHDLLATYRDDFAKYSRELPLERLEETLSAVPRMLGEKFVYSRVNKTIKTNIVKQALEQLTKARICHRIMACSANGLPLAAESNDKFIKVIFLDVGLVSSMLGLRLDQIKQIDDLNLVNQGAISEQVVGQMLRTLSPSYVEPNLYYWTREQKSSSAEIDYVFANNNQVIPIEVKSGSTGTLKSLHLFMHLKKLSRAVRINADFPSQGIVGTKLSDGKTVNYQLLSIPFYLVGQLERLLTGNIGKI